MKILFDYRSFSLQKIGGISRYFIELNKKFQNNKIQSRIFAPIHRNDFLKNEKNNSKINIYLKNYPPFTSGLIDNYNFYLTNFILNYEKPNILHQTYYSDRKFSINKKKTKVILTVYDLIHEIFYKDFGFKNSHRPKLKSLNQADYIICISKKTKEDLLKIYDLPESKVKVVHLGFAQLNKYEEIKSGFLTFPYILFVGSRKRYKNYFNLLKAYSISCKLKKDFKIVCFGGGEFSLEEKKIVSDLNIDQKQIYQINGDDKILNYLYRNAELFVFPSLYEGFGLPTLEAMGNQCPVLLSSISVFKEISNNSAAYFDPYSPESIKNTIEETIYSETKKNILKKRGLENIKKFTWDKCAAETIEAYKKII